VTCPAPRWGEAAESFVGRTQVAGAPKGRGLVAMGEAKPGDNRAQRNPWIAGSLLNPAPKG